MIDKIQFIDADGKEIKVGSVLLNIYDKRRGVVVDLADDSGKWMRYSILPPCLGDMRIKLEPGLYRVTNSCSEWKHIPHDDQTYRERYESWFVRPHYYDDSKPIGEEVDLLISGICSISSKKILDDYEKMDIISIEESLLRLVEHLEEKYGKTTL